MKMSPKGSGEGHWDFSVWEERPRLWLKKKKKFPMENSTEAPQETKNKVAIWSSNPTPGHISGENANLKRNTPTFIAALFTIAKTRKQPKCPSTEEWIKKVWLMYIMKYYHGKEWSNAIFSNMDRSRDHTKWSQSKREKYYMTSLIHGT